MYKRGMSDYYYKFGIFSIVVFLIFILTGSSALQNASLSSNPTLRHKGSRPPRTIWGETSTKELSFAIVADLDRQSLDKTAKKPTWKSYFQRGKLIPDGAGGYQLEWGERSEIKSNLGEAGRGFELSELVSFEDKLLTFDDRSGIVFEILKKNLKAIPRHILMEGDGDQTKGQKTEWATVKDGKLYVGSFGKPFTENGVPTSKNNLWISIIDPSGAISHEDWTERFEFMQRVTGSEWPGYMIHEAIHWDSINRQWYVLPRRISSEAYDEKKDEEMGSNKMLVFDESFSKLLKMHDIGKLVRTHGWSSFKFLPFTNNQVIAGLRTEELEDKSTGEGSQDTFITVFDTNGNVLIPETIIPGHFKYEGLEFL